MAHAALPEQLNSKQHVSKMRGYPRFFGIAFAAVAGSAVDPNNITTSRDQYIYWTYQSTCDESGGGISAIRGFVANESFDVKGAASFNGPGPSCPREMACFFGPDSDACRHLPSNGVTASTLNAVLDDGRVYECDTSNPLTEEDVCTVYDGDACFQSSIYPSCTSGYVFQDELSDLPTLIANPSETEQMDLSQYYYIIFYDDEGCTDPVGIRGFVSDEQYQLTLLSDAVTCEDAMACLYNLGGDSCKERAGGEAPVSFTYKFDPANDGSVSCLEKTLVDDMAVARPGMARPAVDCVDDIPPDRCVQSGAFTASPCMFRVVSAPYLARNPGAIVGNFGGNDGGDNTSDATIHTARYMLVVVAASVFLHL